MKVKPWLFFLAALVYASICAPVVAQHRLAEADRELTLSSGLSVEGVGRWGRRAINVDGVQAMIVERALGEVKEGDEVALPRGMDGHQAWKRAKVDQQGAFPGDRAGWLLCAVESDMERVMVLEARGHMMVYVNGESRMGDPYSTGYVRLPVLMRKGENSLLFAVAGRGGVSAKLVAPRGEMEILGEDLTAPDLRAGTHGLQVFGVPLLNAGVREREVTLTAARGDAEGPEVAGETITLAPLSVVKAVGRADAGPVEAGAEVPVVLRIREGPGEGGRVLAQRRVVFKSTDGRGAHRRTFVSRVDGSVQYYSVVPATGDTGAAGRRPGLVLSLHGASVEATNQAASYRARPALVIACPTNRRPFGFDWEDWGRIDAVEVMDLAIRDFETDPRRQYLTGHSMGGHGTWQLGVLYPARFAAVAPSAGWLSFDTYMSARPDAPKADESRFAVAIRTAAASSDTPSFMPNLRGKGVYILHGDKDDNVPVEQARQAREVLEGLKIPFEYHEQPGAGHWWGDESSGAACLDWAPIFAMFDRCALPDAPVTPVIAPPLDERGFPRGSFKRVFDRDFVLVYGTIGTPEENAWSLNKARYDAEQWWYRGNGRAVVMADRDFGRLLAGRAGNGPNVILYGNQESNLAWRGWAGQDGRVELRRERVRVQDRTLAGDDVGVLAIIADGDRLVGAVGGTGLRGMRAVDRIPYFTSGVGVPEVVVVRSSIWSDGMGAVEGVSDPLAAGRNTSMVWKEVSAGD